MFVLTLNSIKFKLQIQCTVRVGILNENDFVIDFAFPIREKILHQCATQSSFYHTKLVFVVVVVLFLVD